MANVLVRGIERTGTFNEILRSRVADCATQTACRFLRDDGCETVWTYDDLQRRWSAIGAALSGGCPAGGRALILMPQGLNYVGAFFACLYSGRIAVPAFPPRPNRASSRLERIAVDAQPSLVLTDRATLDALAPHLSKWPELSALPWLAVDDIPDAAAADFQEAEIDPDAPAFLQYTSGSTGAPKGVMVSQTNILHNLQMVESVLAPVERLITISWQPLYHDMGLIGCLLEPLFQGGETTLMTPAAFLQRPLDWLAAITRFRATHCGGPNFAYDLCVDRIGEAERARLDLSSWQQTFCGAEPIRAATLDRFARAFESCGFRRSVFYPTYGMAESTLIITGGRPCTEPRYLNVERAALAEHRAVEASTGATDVQTLVGCGRALLEQRIAIVDPHTRAALGDGLVGEVWATGPSVARGYWNQPELSAATFEAQRADEDDSNYLRTGDLGFVHEGELYITGRLKDVIILRGANYYPHDIERTVEGAHEAAAAYGCAAFGVSADDREELVVVQEISRESRRADLDEVLTAIREAVVAEHDVVPAAIVLIKPLTLPKTTSGKVQRSACREAYLADELAVLARWSPPSKDAKAAAAGEASPTDVDATPLAGEQPIRDWLVRRIAERMGVAPQKIDVRAPFDRFGMDSLSAVALADELGKCLGRKLPATLVYEYPTIEMAARRAARLDESTLTSDEGRRARALAEPLAIVGMACRFPGGVSTPAEFWKLLHEGRDAIVEVPADRWNADLWYDANPDTPGKMSTRWGGFLQQPVDEFDAPFFGVSPREAVSLDPQHRLLLETAWEALENAGMAADSLRGSDTGVFVGISTRDYAEMLQVGSAGDPRVIDAYTGSAGTTSLAAGRLSYFLGVNGPCVPVDTACSSSLVALHFAAQSLHAGECRAALVGGVNLMLNPDSTVFFSKLHAMSADGRCKAFDAAADGYVRGEGCGVVVVKRLSDAVADGDRVLALVRGTAVNHGGQSNGLFAPNAAAQEKVIRQALAAAEVSPAEVAFVESHGTGTALGDPIEMRGLAAVFAEGRTAERPLRIGALKTNIGHLEAAAGIAGLIKVVLSMEHEELPAQLHFRRMNPHISTADGRLTPVLDPTPWPRGARRRIAGISSFGFGGTNAHVVLEEAPQLSPAVDAIARPRHLMTLSAPNAESLQATAERYRVHLERHPELAPADVCHTAAVGRTHFVERSAFAVESREELLEKLRSVAAGAARRDVVRGRAVTGQSPPVAFLFTGQGSQYPGMGRGLYDTQPSVRRTLDRCDALARAEFGFPLLDIMFGESNRAASLDSTAYAQPAIFALEAALVELWQSWGVRPAWVIGHSVGEFAAAFTSGILTLDDAFRLVARRGRLMNDAPGCGAMAAVFAAERDVAEWLKPYATHAAVAAINGPRNTVVSGPRDVLDEFLGKLSERAVRWQSLTVSHAFHSPLMDPILEQFASAAAQVRFSKPNVPLVSNLTGCLVNGEACTTDYWRKHVRAPVRFADGMQTLAAAGCRVFLEIGPKPVLTGLGRECVELPDAAWIASLRNGQDAWQSLLGGLAELYVRGAAIDWRGFDADYVRHRVSLPNYGFQRKKFWLATDVAGRERRLLRLSEYSRDRVHPLLGTRLSSPLAVRQHQAEWGDEARRLLADHVVMGAVVFPAAGFCELALAAAAEAWPGRAVAIDELQIAKPLVVAPDGPTTVQTVFHPEGDDGGRIEVFRHDAGATPDAWISHAAGRVRTAVEGIPEFLDFESLRQEPANSLDVQTFYAGLTEVGLKYGPKFRALQSIQVGPHGALGRLEFAADAQPNDYLLHPALLDGGLQLLAAVIGDEQGDTPYLPTVVRGLTIAASVTGPLWCRAQLHGEPAGDAQQLTAELWFYDDDGRPAAHVAELTLMRLPSIGATAENLRDRLYDVSWEACEAPRVAGNRPAAGDRLWCVVADDGDPLAQELIGALTEHGESCRRESWTARLPTLDGAAGTAAWGDLLAELRSAPAKNEHFVYLPPTNEVDDWESSARAGCGGILSLAQALTDPNAGEGPGNARLWVVTRGTQAVEPGEAVSPAQAAVWGLCRVIALEQPALGMKCVDLAGADEAAEVAAVVREFIADDAETNIALRGSRRYRSRWSRSVAGPLVPRGDEPYKLAIDRYGLLESLRLAPIVRRAPTAGEVEIEVRAAGLNFRDVLHALGMLREHSATLGIACEADMPFGFECSGIVSAIGEGVTHVAVGDAVIAAPAAGTLASHVVVPGPFVVAKPQTIGFDDAATVPITFLTALYALREVAELKPGERVLIHSAAGGVGQAAVQLAQAIGAEVFATASEGKWDVLRRQGVRHVMNSRTLDFSEQIAAATGGEGVQVVLNSFNGDFIPRSLAVVARGGRFIEIGKLGIWTDEQMRIARDDVNYRAFDLAELAQTQPNLIARLLRELVDLIAAGKLRPLPCEAFALADAQSAFRRMAQAKHVGKVVVAMPAESSRARVRDDRTYLITGGLGALGLRTAHFLADRGAKHVALVGRGAPNADARHSIDRLSRRGVEVRAVALDVSSADDVRRLVAEVQASPHPLGGVVHAAGVLDDGVVGQQTWRRFREVLAPKIAGAKNLHDATIGLPLDFFICYSSVAAAIGSPGQANYAAANAYLDALAASRRAQGLPGLSIAWGPWAGGGMASRSAGKRRAAPAMPPLRPAAAVRLLGEALDRPPIRGHVVAAHVDWSVLLGQFPGAPPPALSSMLGEMKPGAQTGKQSAAAAELLACFGELSEADRQRRVTEFVAGQTARVLGFGSADEIDRGKPLQRLGLDSLMGVELKNHLELEFGVAIPMAVLFEGGSIEQLAAKLVAQLSAAANSSTESASPRSPSQSSPSANGHAANGHAANGHASNGHHGNGHAANGHAAHGSPSNGRTNPAIFTGGRDAGNHAIAPVEATAHGALHDPEALLERLDDLTDEEVERLLQAALEGNESRR